MTKTISHLLNLNYKTINLNILHNMKFIFKALLPFFVLIHSKVLTGVCPFSAGAGAGFVSRVTRKEV